LVYSRLGLNVANEITFGWSSGVSLEANAYTPAGDQRGATVTMTEIGASGLYTGDLSTIETGDLVIVDDGTNNVGWGEYEPTVNLKDDAITASKYDESTAFPLVLVDTGTTKVARTGADSDTLETLSDEIATKTGYKLASDGLDSIAITEPSGVASNFREMVVQLWRRFFGKSTLSKTEIKNYKADGITVTTTQDVTETPTIQTQGEAS